MQIRGLELTYPRLLVGALLVVTLFAGGYAASTSTDSFGSYNPNWDGSRELRLLAQSHADTTLVRNTAAYNTGNRLANETTALVLSPGEPYTAESVQHIRRFVERGGTLVLAGDFKPYANQLLSRLGADSRIDGRLVRDERYYYRSPALPVARNVSAPLNATVDQLTLNHASVVRPGPNATVLVATSGYAYLDENRNASLDETETLGTYPVVVSEPLGDGRLVVVSDPSVFINTMLTRPSNRAFARSLLTTNPNVLLDYSHTSTVPPLAALLLLLQGSPLLQFLLGVSLIVVGWLGSRGVSWTLFDAEEDATDQALSVAEIEAILEDAHPEWEAERVARVARSIGESKEGSVDD